MSQGTEVRAGVLGPLECASVLAARLSRIGFAAEVESAGPEQAVLVSTGPGLRVHGEVFVFVAPDASGRLCFWWSPTQPIAPLEDLNAAVLAITRMLPCPGEGCRICAESEYEDGEFEW